MILVDTSVWIDHFRTGGSKLGDLLRQSLVRVHPFVIGELACGNLKAWARILSDLEALPSALSATHEEVIRLVEARKLWGLGMGWIDVHLLASALLSNCQLWTLDGKLVQAASAAGVKLYHPAGWSNCARCSAEERKLRVPPYYRCFGGVSRDLG